MNFRTILPWIVISMVTLTACDAGVDLKNVTGSAGWHPGLIIPLVSADASLGQILTNYIQDSSVQVGSDSLEIEYITNDSAEIAFSHPDFLSSSLDLPKSTTFSSFQTIDSTNYTFFSSDEFLPVFINTSDSMRVDSVQVNSAKFEVTIQASPDIVAQGLSAFKLSFDFPADKWRFSQPGDNHQELNILSLNVPADLLLNDFSMINTGNVNKLPVHLTLQTMNGARFNVQPGSYVNCNIRFGEITYSVVYGSFATTFSGNTVLREKIPVQHLIPVGTLRPYNPVISLQSETNVGNSMKLNIDYIKSYHSDNMSGGVNYAWFDNHTTNSVSAVIPNRLTVPGQWKDTTFLTLDRNNGEINRLFNDSTQPDMIEYQFSAALVNSAENNILPNFLLTDNRIKIKLKTVIPFYLDNGSFYEYNDTIGNFFSTINNAIKQFPVGSIDSVALVLKVKNGLPVNASLHVSILDQSGGSISTGFKSDYVLPAGIPDANGIVNPANKTTTLIVMGASKADLNILADAAKIAYKVRLEGKDLSSKIHLNALSDISLNAGLYISAATDSLSVNK